MKLKAFNLVELLITLASIGVVAVLVVPNVVNHVYEKTNTESLRINYSKIDDAVKNALLDSKVSYWSDTNYVDDEDSIQKFFTDYMTVSIICDTTSDCFAESYKTLDKSDFLFNTLYKFDTMLKLTSGASIAIKVPTMSDLGFILMDVNSLNPPNVLGRDLFYLEFDNKGNIGAMSAENTSSDDAFAKCVDAEDPVMCLYLVQSDGWAPIK